MGRKQTEETKRRISQSMKGNHNNITSPFKKGYDSRRYIFKKEDRVKAVKRLRERQELRLLDLNFEDYPSRLIKQIVLAEQNHKCLCGLDKWKGNILILELDHIDGNNKNNKRKNLRVLCPNCHSQTPTYKNKKRDS